MINEIQLSCNELKSLKQNFLSHFSLIKWWLFKYHDLYKEVTIAHKKLCVKCIEFSKENLPYDCLRKPDYCNKRVEYQEFIKLYDELDGIAQCHN